MNHHPQTIDPAADPSLVHGVDTHSAIPSTSDPSEILIARFTSYTKLIKSLSSYFSHAESLQKHQSKEYEKLAKHIEVPSSSQGGQFIEGSTGQGLGGIFANLQHAAVSQSAAHADLSKSISASILHTLDRLEHDVKAKIKDLKGDGSKGFKSVTKARNETEKHIELLGKHTATFGTSSKGDVKSDPYLVHRGVQHLLAKQTEEENAQMSAMIQLQNECAQLERRITQVVQEVVGSYATYAIHAQQTTTKILTDASQKANLVPADAEWNAFTARERSLVDPRAPARDWKALTFPNMEHEATKPLAAGYLQRKGKLIKSYNDPAYYTLSPSLFLHEFKSDNPHTDPDPVMSLYVPECTVGGYRDAEGKFVVGGKEKKMLSRGHEYKFKAANPGEGEKWWTALVQASGGGKGGGMTPASTFGSESEPTSPVNESMSGYGTDVEGVQQGVQNMNMGHGYGSEPNPYAPQSGKYGTAGDDLR
ncbi:hypothetical protein YB2330_000786 [Saitoella coloradoensis]